MKYTKENLLEKYGKAETLWNTLDTKKMSAKRTVWEQCALLTLPSLFPVSGTNETSTFDTPYNSIGTNAVENLTAKLTEQLLPPVGNFFRLMPISEKVEKLTVEQFQELDKALSKLEVDIVSLIAAQALTVNVYDAVKLLIVTGNTLLYKNPKGPFSVYNPANYCVERDHVGNVMTMILKDKVNVKFLPEEFIKNEKKEGEKEENEDENIYTCVYRVSNTKWVAYQEVDGQILSTTIMNYTNENLPYIALRWSAIHNEDYGRGLVEKYLGDLRSLEALTQAIVEGTSIMAKVILGLKPASKTKASDLNNAKNGDIILGDLNQDLTTFRVDKGMDFSIALQLMQALEQRLGKAFLMFSSTVRDSERTTAAEIQATVNELNSALGGTFSVLAQEFQLPLLRILLNEVEPKALKITTPSIVTGAAAMSRQMDIVNLKELLNDISIFGPEAVNASINIDGYVTEMAKARGVEPTKILKSPEDKQAEAQAMQQAQQEQAMMEQQSSQGGM